MILALASLTVLRAALFVPLFAVIVIWCLATISVWQLSPSVALLCVAAISAINLVPLYSSSGKYWMVPSIFGVILLIAVVSAVVHMFTIINVNGTLFCLDGLILLAAGALCCIAEGFVLKTQSN